MRADPATTDRPLADCEPSTVGDVRTDLPEIERLFELTGDPLATLSTDGHFTLLNPAWEQLLAWRHDELQALTIQELMHPDEVEPALSQDANVENFTSRFRHRDGSWRWLLWSARRHGDTWYVSAKDVTDRAGLGREALHDPLTRLPNRLLLVDRARQALARLHRNSRVVAMLFIDLDRFKAVNDNFGHSVGDRLLVAISERLGDLLRDSDTLSRLGGDEFVILAEEIDNDAEALALGERVLDAMDKPFPLGPARVAMVASVGVSVSHDPTIEPETMLQEADLAMYRAKSAGGRCVRLFDETLRQEVNAHAQTEVRLKEALTRHELRLLYQPILKLAGGQAVGCEALLRWFPRGTDGSQEGELLPAAFLPSVEDSELIVQIGYWVFHTACEQAAVWSRRGKSVPISVNVSARELNELDLAERIHEALVYYRLPGRALRVEVSEAAVLRDPQRARSALEDVRRLGVSIALDKFGTGQLSVGLPRNLPVDTVKLDSGLTSSFDRDKDRRAIFAAAVALAREARLVAVAVGIETKRQFALARELDCSAGQGFLLHSPTSPDRVRLSYFAGSATSPPWRPIVKLRGSDRRR